MSRADPAELIDLVFAVKQNNLDLLEERLLDVSNPYSDSYGDHLNHDEVNALVTSCAGATPARAHRLARTCC